MSQASLRAKSPRRRRKKRSEFKRSPFGGQQQSFNRGLAATDRPEIDFGVVVAAVNQLFRRITQARGR